MGQHQERLTLFAELLLPVPLGRLFTYRIPFELNEKVQQGQRAIVQFGDRRILTGVIITVHDQPPKDYEAKLILDLLDDHPVLNSRQLELFEWISRYYLCTQGEVLQAALPSGLKLSSESRVQLHPAFDPETTLFEFSEKEHQLLNNLRNDSMSYSEISKLLGIRHIYSLLRSLVTKEAVILYEEVREKYSPQTEKRIRLTSSFADSAALEELFKTLGKKQKQEELLLAYLQKVPVLHDKMANTRGIAKHELLELGLSASSLNTLIKNQVFEEFEKTVPRFPEIEGTAPIPALSDDQKKAYDEIHKSLSERPITLLHGITGSGKTELYVHLIKEALDAGSQVLYLLPEIALTTQIVKRLQKVFGSTMGVYHSKFSDNERVEVWQGVLDGRFRFVAGVRSSVFLPFDNLGLIIVDEEHDSSYKQQDPAPRYHARDVAAVLAQFHHAKVLLGSATPSMESIIQARQGKYGYVKLTKRFGDVPLPEIVLADLGRERKQKTNKGDYTEKFLSGIGNALTNKEQVIVFQNRRGYSLVSCNDCGWVPKCVNCAVSLTYHQYRNTMVCHYCGYREQLPSNCPTCTSTRILTPGYGTEKIEEELRQYFPDARIQRFDLDTTRTKKGYETILEEFSEGQIDILVGTQMVTKGMDFDRVSTVGIFNADRMMHFPDFRSYERAYQLIVQVSGRAGRREKQGKVIIQTTNTQHPVLLFLQHGDQETFYDHQLEDRRQHGYPPYTRLIQMTVKHQDKNICRTAAGHLTEDLREALPDLRILGPGEPMIYRIKNQFLMNSLIKIPRNRKDLPAIKEKIRQIIDAFEKNKEFRNARVVIDVDPV